MDCNRPKWGFRNSKKNHWNFWNHPNSVLIIHFVKIQIPQKFFSVHFWRKTPDSGVKKDSKKNFRKFFLEEFHKINKKHFFGQNLDFPELRWFQKKLFSQRNSRMEIHILVLTFYFLWVSSINFIIFLVPESISKLFFDVWTQKDKIGQ